MPALATRACLVLAAFAVVSGALASAPTAASFALVDGMNAWAARAVADLEASSPSLTRRLRERLEEVGRFSRASLPLVTHALPVLYLFSGSDLLTAAALFPTAPDYTLVADLPHGEPACFLEPACMARANASSHAFFAHWEGLRFARQSSNSMRRAFARTGVLPALLLSLRLVGEPILHVGPLSAESPNQLRAEPPVEPYGGRSANRSAAGVSLRGVVLHTARCRVRYISLMLCSDPSERDSAVLAGERQQWPVLSRWERGGPFVHAQLDALSRVIGPRLHVSVSAASMHGV